jgi:serine O-acetyltransferase
MSDIIDSFPKRLYKMSQRLNRHVPSQVRTQTFIDQMVNLFFLMRDDQEIALSQIEAKWKWLQVELKAILEPLCETREISRAGTMAEDFFKELPSLYPQLLKDAKLYSECDPAAGSMEEIILCYPGFYAIVIYRMAHILYKMGIPFIPRLFCEYAHSRTGIEIHPGASIGRRFYIDHGTGIVIGETAIIGSDVKIYQGVTLGATYVDKSFSGVKRHPTIGSHVIIYAGSTILGGDTVIGHHSVIGGNVWLTESVPPYSTVYHRIGIHIKNNDANRPDRFS